MTDLPENTIPLLDKGYIRLVDVMGSDLTVANSARVSYDKQSVSLSEKDKGLINFLAEHGHTSPFRHAVAQFEVYAPLFIARQWFKHLVSSTHSEEQFAWNESSRRYITEEAKFYIPDFKDWRTAPENSKQGSGEENLDEYTGKMVTENLLHYIKEGERLYEEAMNLGIAPEQARLFLPAYGMYVRWYWTGSLQSIAHFIKLRDESSAQYEIQLYAKAARDLLLPHYKYSLEALL